MSKIENPRLKSKIACNDDQCTERFIDTERILSCKLGLRLRECRLMCKLSQEQLADLTGTNRTYISDVERGLSSPTIAMLAKLARALEIKMWKLVHDIEVQAV